MAKRAESRTTAGSQKTEPGERAGGGAAPAKKGTSGKAASAKAATPWGSASVVAEAKVAQRAGDKRFSSILQLLETDRGEPLVRIAYTTDGVVRRGPVTLRPKDVERLRAALDPGSALAAALGWSDEPDGLEESVRSGGEA
jgi:hypothetical protein